MCKMLGIKEEKMSKLIKYINEEEFDKLFSKEKKREYKIAYLLAFGCGLRISEIIGFKRKDGTEIKPLGPEQINIKEKSLRIMGKGGKERIVPLFPGFKEEYLKLLPLKIKRITLQTHFSKLCKKVLGEKRNFHQLRHGFAVASVKRGIKLPFLQMALGHSRLDTTGIYTAAAPEDMLADYKKVWGNV